MWGTISLRYLHFFMYKYKNTKTIKLTVLLINSIENVTIQYKN